MTLTQKQLDASLKKAVEAVEESMARIVNTAFQEHQNLTNDRLARMDQKLDTISTTVTNTYNVVTKWPAPSEIDKLFERVNHIEQVLNIKSDS
ncbi:MAG: hypothetical protein K1Y02_13300 [Candidatus Hydrogenedentes bacterium]|nr:hypothetical protein [Candidatus Hydrogenedentota bacterium]